MLVGLSPIMDLTKDSNMDITSKMRPALLTIFVTVFNINLSNAETINLPKLSEFESKLETKISEELTKTDAPAEKVKVKLDEDI